MLFTRASLCVATFITLGLVPVSAQAQQRIRIEDVPGIRSRAPQNRVEVRVRPVSPRESQWERAWEQRERQDRLSMRETERAREMNARLRERQIERAEAQRERARELRERARERARQRDAEECEAAERRRELARVRAIHVRRL
jgi:hypothetical protein